MAKPSETTMAARWVKQLFDRKAPGLANERKAFLQMMKSHIVVVGNPGRPTIRFVDKAELMKVIREC